MYLTINGVDVKSPATEVDQALVQLAKKAGRLDEEGQTYLAESVQSLIIWLTAAGNSKVFEVHSLALTAAHLMMIRQARQITTSEVVQQMMANAPTTGTIQ